MPFPNEHAQSPAAQTTDTQGGSILSGHQWKDLAESLGLSGRELEIVQAIFNDQSQDGIAQQLGISPHTVHTHMERLYHKLAVSSRCGVVVRLFREYLSLERGIADLPPSDITKRPGHRVRRV
jgi:ATP/maltotriose-dependent transcriptional regulator MalT